MFEQLINLVTKRIKDLVSQDTLTGFFPIDSAAFGTKKFDASKLATKEMVEAGLNDLDTALADETAARTALGMTVTELSAMVKSSLHFKGSMSTADISALNVSSISNGAVYSCTDAGDITYYSSSAKAMVTLKARKFDEVAWNGTDWYIIGQDRDTDLSEYTKTANLAAVAFSNSYNDLDDKPEIPAEQVNSDWNASEGKAAILNKPTLAALALSGTWDDILGKPNFHSVATSGDYSDLSNKPTVGNGIITLQVNGTTADSFSANANDDKTINLQVTVPTKTSDLTNDAGFITLDDISDASANDDGLMSSEDYNKLQGIEANAQVNVKPDWNAEAGSSSEILNKPSIPDVSGKAEKSEMAVEDVSGDVTKKKITLKNGLSVDVVIEHEELSAGNGISINNKVISSDADIVNKSVTVGTGNTAGSVTLDNYKYNEIATFPATVAALSINVPAASAGKLQETAFEFTIPEGSSLTAESIKFYSDSLDVPIEVSGLEALSGSGDTIAGVAVNHRVVCTVFHPTSA